MDDGNAESLTRIRKISNVVCHQRVGPPVDGGFQDLLMVRSRRSPRGGAIQTDPDSSARSRAVPS